MDREQTLMALSQSELIIESVTAPSLELTHRLGILEHRNLGAYWEIGAGTILASDNDTKTGLYFQTGLGVKYKKSWGNLNSSVHYKDLDLPIKNGNQTTQDVGIIFSMGIDL
jgi:hypothetical protein